jgi:spermidine synthase
VVRCELKTFFEVFPAGIVWGNEVNGGGYDVVLFGQSSPAMIDIDALRERLNGNERVSDSLDEVGFHSAADLLATYAGQATDMHEWLANAEINRDRNLRLQYMAGLGVNTDQDRRIYAKMLEYCAFPDNRFQGNGEFLAALKIVILNRNRDAKTIWFNSTIDLAP